MKITTWRSYGVQCRNKLPDFPLASPTVEFIVCTLDRFLNDDHLPGPSPVPIYSSQSIFRPSRFRLIFFSTWPIFSLPVSRVLCHTQIRCWYRCELSPRSKSSSENTAVDYYASRCNVTGFTWLQQQLTYCKNALENYHHWN